MPVTGFHRRHVDGATAVDGTGGATVPLLAHALVHPLADFGTRALQRVGAIVGARVFRPRHVQTRPLFLFDDLGWPELFETVDGETNAERGSVAHFGHVPQRLFHARDLFQREMHVPSRVVGH